MPLTQLKGHGFNASVAALERMTNRTTVERILAQCATFGPMFKSKAIVSSGFYPISLYAEFTRAMHAELGADISVRMGRETTLADVNSLFRFVLHLFSAESIARFVPRLFRTYVQGPDALVESSSAKLMQTHFFNFEGCTQGIYEEFMAGTAMFVELGGGKNCKFNVIDGGKDDDSWVRFQLSWD